MTARDWLGNRMIDRKTGDLLGRVIRLMAAPDRIAAICLVIRPADPRLPLLVLPWEKATPGKPALADADECLPLTAASPYWSRWEHQLPLGLPGLKADGSSPGRCCDASLDEQGRITGLTFSSGTEVSTENVACIGNAAIILGQREMASAETPAPSNADSPLLGRIVTHPITLPDGRELAHPGQIVDTELVSQAEQAGRMVALTLHTQPPE